MDKFIISKKEKPESSEKQADLLALLTNSRGKSVDHSQTYKASTSKAGASSSSIEWDNYTGNKLDSNLSAFDVLCSSKSFSLKKSKVRTGWSVKDGRKVYTTFRNHSVVVGEGADAVKLAIGDGKLKIKKRINDENCADSQVKKQKK